MPKSRPPSAQTAAQSTTSISARVSEGISPWLVGRRRTLCLAIVVLGVTTIAYYPALKADFIWNDSDYVTAPDLRSFGGLGRIWFEVGATEQYYPLLHSAFWLQHMLFGGAPAGYHVLNLVFHLTATLLFATALRKILTWRSSVSPEPGVAQFPDPTIAAWLAAALFALHPVHVESVAWISEQKNTLSLVFYLVALQLYLRFDETRGRRFYAWALAAFGLAMLSKTATVTLPAALLVLIWWKRGRIDWRSDVRPLLPWLVMGAAAGMFSSWVERYHLGGAGMGAQGTEFNLSWPGHVLLAGRAIWFYFGSLVWPFGLNFIYPRWSFDATSAWQWLYPLATVLALAAVWLMRRRTRTPLAVALLFVGALFPVLGFVSLYGALYSWVWDHWQYLADLAPAAAMATLVASGRAGSRKAGLVAGTAVCLGLAVLTWKRCGDFRDNETLYRTTLARNPDSWMAHNNLGNLLAARPGGQAEAIEHYAAAARLNPGYAEVHYNLGNALAGLPDRVGDAMAEYNTALRLQPDYAMAHNALANVLTRIDGRLPEAIDHYERALRITPAVPDLHNNLGIAFLLSDRPSEAIAQFEEALKLNPNLAQAHMNLAAALEGAGRTGEAAAHYEAARRLGIVVPQ